MSTTTATRPTRDQRRAKVVAEAGETNPLRRVWNGVKNKARQAWNWVKRQVKKVPALYGKLPKIIRVPLNFIAGCVLVVCALYVISCIAYLIALPFLLVSELFASLMYIVAFYGITFFLVFKAIDWADDRKVENLTTIRAV